LKIPSFKIYVYDLGAENALYSLMLQILYEPLFYVWKYVFLFINFTARFIKS
jgi:hypothetical protein